MAFFRLILLCLLLIGCATNRPKNDDTVFFVEFGHDGEYESRTALLTHYMCREDDIKVKIQFTPEQKENIGRIADRTRFFSLPSVLPSTPGENGSVTITSTSANYSINLYHLGKLNHVTWSSDDVHNGLQPLAVRELFSAVMEPLKDTISRLPESKCIYY